jgi:diguanylate cyclase (GGDEF)-like protein
MINSINASISTGAYQYPCTQTDSEENHESPELAAEKFQRMASLNELHSRLATTIDLCGMIEAFSVWLMPRLEHHLLTYYHPGFNHKCIICSCHGDNKKQLVELAENMFAKPGNCLALSPELDKEYFSIDLGHKILNHGKIFILSPRKNNLINFETSHLTDALMVLGTCIPRTLLYEELLEKANKDTLTGLANRRFFKDRIDILIENSKRYGHPLTLGVMDMDRFKTINDSLGHNAGDLVLQQVADTLEDKIRTSDLLARWGGDEFVVAMTDTDIQGAHRVAERLCKSVKKLGQGIIDTEEVGMSIGLVQWEDKYTNMGEWFQRADEALYHAKSSGRSMVTMFT